MHLQLCVTPIDGAGTRRGSLGGESSSSRGVAPGSSAGGVPGAAGPAALPVSYGPFGSQKGDSKEFIDAFRRSLPDEAHDMQE
ncbi:hypothetical protein G6F43_009282 [Rhizopus delemar]|nr:hypothetical protein G6F43_009282 [Rhizopus delemar]